MHNDSLLTTDLLTLRPKSCRSELDGREISKELRNKMRTKLFKLLMDHCDETDAQALHALAAHRDVPRANFARSAARLSTPYNQIFGNLQTIRVTCSACSHVAERYERAHSHELALSDATLRSMQELLDAHLAHEPLGDAYRCDAWASEEHVRKELKFNSGSVC